MNFCSNSAAQSCMSLLQHSNTFNSSFCFNLVKPDTVSFMVAIFVRSLYTKFLETSRNGQKHTTHTGAWHPSVCKIMDMKRYLEPSRKSIIDITMTKVYLRKSNIMITNIYKERRQQQQHSSD